MIQRLHRRFQRPIIILCAILAVGLPALVLANEKAIGKKALEFVLSDQYEQRWTWNRHWKGKHTVLVLSDWKGSDYTAQWTTPLAKRFKDRVQFVALADVSLAPSFLRSYLRDKFKEAYANSILLDWEGDVFTYYVAQPSLPNVIYVAPDGVVKLHTWGKGASDHVDAFATELEKLLSSP